MASSHVLKMFDEGVVHGGASQRAHDWKGLRCHLLGNALLAPIHDR
jgi:hypothetical protein